MIGAGPNSLISDIRVIRGEKKSLPANGANVDEWFFMAEIGRYVGQVKYFCWGEGTIFLFAVFA